MILNVANFWGVEVPEEITDNNLLQEYTQWNVPLTQDQIDNKPSYPYRCRIGIPGAYELVDVIDYQGTTLFVERGKEDTTPLVHPAGSRLEHVFTAGAIETIANEFQSVTSSQGNIVALLYYIFGGRIGIPVNTGYTFLETVAQDTPDDSVKVKAGFALVHESMAFLSQDTNLSGFNVSVTPGQTRIDHVVMTSGGLEIIEGVDGDPHVWNLDADKTKLLIATITFPSGWTVIKDSDDGSNAYIDNTVRAFL